jgi:hypothetical protein
MFTAICHFYPGYTVDKLMRTPLPVIFALYSRITDWMKLRGPM